MAKLLDVLPGARPQMCQFICHGMWSVTPYAQCDFKCVYCCTSAQGESVAVDGLAEATVEHIGELLAAVPSGDLLIFGAFSDAAEPAARGEPSDRPVAALGRAGGVAVVSPAVAAGVPGLIEQIPECGGAYAVNPYSGCDIRCVYCITGMQGRSTPRASSRDTRAAMQRAVRAATPADRFVVGAISDAYPSVDRRERRARIVVAELTKTGQPFSIVTKSPDVVSDLDILASSHATVTVSLCTTDDAALSWLDPGGAPHRERLEALRTLSDAGVAVALSVAPFMPDVTGVDHVVKVAHDVVGPHLWSVVSALNVRAAAVAGSHFGRPWRQAEVNAAFFEAQRASSVACSTTWLQPPPLDDASAACAFEGLPGTHSRHDATPVVLGARLQPAM